MTHSDTSLDPHASSSAADASQEIRYTMWSVFRVSEPLGEGTDRGLLAAQVQGLFDQLAEKDVVIRGTYDVAGLRADADLMIWWHSASCDDLQEAYHRLRRTELGRHLEPVWSQLGVHRPAEFNKEHIPSFLSGTDSRDYICVYPFVRSYDWYVLPDEERSAMLTEHGALARDFSDVQPNTVAAFALGDYEWLLAFEADELHRIVDLMRNLRAARARLHVREEVPFYTGRRKPISEIVVDLP